MTAKNIKKKSDPLDRYYTPKWVTKQCFDLVVPEICPTPAAILEPGAGTGNFIDRARERFPDSRIVGFEFDPAAKGWSNADESLLKLDFTTTKGLLRVAKTAPNGGFDLAIGNPPFTHAQAFIENSLKVADTLIFLLRQGFLSSEKRFPFWQEFPPTHLFTLCNRPKFVEGSGGDSADYCFLCYDGHEMKVGEPAKFYQLPPVSLEERKAG